MEENGGEEMLYAQGCECGQNPKIQFRKIKFDLRR
jgi:hypothetical protein